MSKDFFYMKVVKNQNFSNFCDKPKNIVYFMILCFFYSKMMKKML